MINVKFFGVLRLKTGIQELKVEANSVAELCKRIAESGEARNADPPLGAKELKDCLIVVNGKQAKLSGKLSDGDCVMIMTAAAGG